MSTSDGIALTSTVIAIGALLLSWRASRQQERKDTSAEARAKADRIDAIQTELADRINSIQAQMTRPGQQPPSSRPMDMFANGFAAVATLRALVPRTAALMEAAERENLEVNWFQTQVLAGAFLA